jgi:hypothetical protein
VPVQPYFVTALPGSQWISVSATNWAVMALALLDRPCNEAHRLRAEVGSNPASATICSDLRVLNFEGPLKSSLL